MHAHLSLAVDNRPLLNSQIFSSLSRIVMRVSLLYSLPSCHSHMTLSNRLLCDHICDDFILLIDSFKVPLHTLSSTKQILRKELLEQSSMFCSYDITLTAL